MRKALIVGINYYKHGTQLQGCVNDAQAVKTVLEEHENGKPNFGVETLISSDESSLVNKKDLKLEIKKLFRDDNDIALFYFSGHGHIEDTGGYLITSDCITGDEGLSMDEIMKIVNNSKAKNKIIIFDCCHSGYFGNYDFSGHMKISKGTVILTASAENQYAKEIDGQGVFTSLFIDALKGNAANVLGEITLGSIYAHIDRSLGPWKQRPLFKANIKNFHSVRDVNPPIELKLLKQITTFFKDKDYEYPLDPSYEKTHKLAILENTKKFEILQGYKGVGLVIQIGEKHMYYAAIRSKSCKLTALGKFYWSLIKAKRI